MPGFFDDPNAPPLATDPPGYYIDPNIGDARPNGGLGTPSAPGLGTLGSSLTPPTPGAPGRVYLDSGGYTNYGANGQVTGGASGAPVGTSGGSIPIPKAGDRAGIRAWVVATANANGRPEIASNPDYYVDQIFSKGGDVGDGKWWTDNIRGGGEMPGSGGSGSAGGGSLGSFGTSGGGDLLAPYTGTFSAPTGTDDPGFQFALQQGQDAIQRSAAAKGTLLTGGTLKDLASYTTGAALQNYGDAYNRAFNTFQTNYGVFRNNQMDPFNKLYSTSQLGLTGAQDYSGALGQGFSNYADATNPSGLQNLGLSRGNLNAAGAVNQGTNLSNYANLAGNLVGAFYRPTPKTA